MRHQVLLVDQVGLMVGMFMVIFVLSLGFGDPNLSLLLRRASSLEELLSLPLMLLLHCVPDLQGLRLCDGALRDLFQLFWVLLVPEVVGPGIP